MAFNLGDIFVTFKAKTDQLESATTTVTKNLDKVNDGANKVNDSMTKTGVVIGAVSGIVQTVFNKAVTAVSDTIDDAIKRVDTLNNSARTFANMGFAASDVKVAMDALDKSIRGLPTSLDGATRNVTLLAAATNDIGKSQKIFAALNDGILGFGGSTEMVDNATVQLSQDLAGGRITAQTWLSLLNSGFGPALNAIARQMGITISALKDGLGDGSISVDTFTDSLIKLDKEGGGGMQSLQKIAKDSTSGIATGWQNAQTAITRGIAAIIQQIGSSNISGAISAIGSAAEQAFKLIASGIKYIIDNKDIFTALAVAIGAATAALLLFNAALAVQEWIAAFGVLKFGAAAFLQVESASKLVTAAQWALNAALRANPIGIIVTLVIALIAGLAFFFTQTKTGQAIMQKFFDIMITGFKAVSKWASDVWAVVAGFFAAVGKSVGDFWQGVVGTFNDFVRFLQQWGPTILAILFWPWSLALGLIISNWSAISGFFEGVWSTIAGIWSGVVGFFQGVVQGVIDVFTPIIGFIAGIYIAEWNAIVAIWNGAVQFFTGVWNGLVQLFSPVAGWLTSVFAAAYNGITGMFGNLVGFFQGIWRSIVGIFTPIGTTVGNAIAGAFRGVVNSVLSNAVGIINTFIGMINGVTGIINKIPGVHVGQIGRLGIPQFSTGVENFAGGWAVVGDVAGKGGELINLPKGSNVYSNADSKRMLGGGGGVKIYGNVNIDSEADADFLLQRMDRNAKLENMGLSPT